MIQATLKKDRRKKLYDLYNSTSKYCNNILDFSRKILSEIFINKTN